VFEDLFQIDERWSFSLGPRCFDRETCLNNLNCVKDLIDLADKNNLKLIFGGILSLILHYGKTYRNPEDIDILIERDKVTEWLDVLFSNGSILCEERTGNGSYEDVMEIYHKNYEKFASINENKNSSEYSSACIYEYNNGIFQIKEFDNPVNNYHSRKNPSVLIHNPNNKDEFLIEEDHFQVLLKTPFFEQSFRSIGFLYYTNDLSNPVGECGVPAEQTKIEKLYFKKNTKLIDRKGEVIPQFTYWASEKIDKKNLKNLKYRIGLFHPGAITLENPEKNMVLDVIIDEPDRTSEKNYNYKIFDGRKLFYSIPEYVWRKKMNYNRPKDIADKKYFTKIISNIN